MAVGNERYTVGRKRYTIGNRSYIVACMEDTLWARWVHHVYLKKSTWWDYKCPEDSSWVWRQIVTVKEILGLGFNSNSGKWRVAKSGIYSLASGHKWLVGSLSAQHWTKYAIHNSKTTPNLKNSTTNSTQTIKSSTVTH